MRELLLLSIAVLVVSCGGEDTTDDQPIEDPCTRGALEADLISQDQNGQPAAVALRGPGVDPATGALRPPASGEYVVATTYLRLLADEPGRQKFQQLTGPVIGRLMQSPGLVAQSTAFSMSCGTARTLTIWENEAAMMTFVVSAEHGAAMSGVGQVSRGGSVTLRWSEADATKIGWPTVGERLMTHNGPEY